MATPVLINSTRPGVAIKAVCIAAICLVCNDILLLQVVRACPMCSVLLGIIALEEINWRESERETEEEEEGQDKILKINKVCVCKDATLQSDSFHLAISSVALVFLALSLRSEPL